MERLFCRRGIYAELIRGESLLSESLLLFRVNEVNVWVTSLLGFSGGAMGYLSKLGKQAETVAGNFWGHSKSTKWFY